MYEYIEYHLIIKKALVRLRIELELTLNELIEMGLNVRLKSISLDKPK